jgi:hypothetical protein
MFQPQIPNSMVILRKTEKAYSFFLITITATYFIHEKLNKTAFKKTTQK